MWKSVPSPVLPCYDHSGFVTLCDRTNICDMRVSGLSDLFAWLLVYCIAALARVMNVLYVFVCQYGIATHVMLSCSAWLPGRGDVLRRCNLQASFCSHHGQIPRLSAGVVASDQHLLQAPMRWLSWIYDEGWGTRPNLVKPFSNTKSCWWFMILSTVNLIHDVFIYIANC